MASQSNEYKGYLDRENRDDADKWAHEAIRERKLPAHKANLVHRKAIKGLVAVKPK